VRGVVNQVWDAPTQQMRVGRFGWKANVATLAHQTGGAFLGDMGITSPLFPNETCTARRRTAWPRRAARRARRPRSTRRPFDDVVFYESTLAPAARRNPKDPRWCRARNCLPPRNALPATARVT
jgi:CxxC motif-containing protein (DUF1111 family)